MTEPGLVSKAPEWVHKGPWEKSFYLSKCHFPISERGLQILASLQNFGEDKMGMGDINVLYTCNTKKAITEDIIISTVSDKPDDQI